MIIRILGDGRYDVPDSELADIENLDKALVDALDGDDSAAFSDALASLIATVRSKGSLIPADDVRTSQQAVPHEGSELAEVKALLEDAG
jgi:hypothetical protein